MPLHAEVEREPWILQPFDNSVRSLCCDAEPLSHVTDGLMVRGVDVHLALTEDRGELGSRLNRNIVTEAVLGLAGVADLGLHLRVDVLDQRAAGRDVHHLQSEADPESRNPELAGSLREGEVIFLAANVHRFDRGVPVLSVESRIAVKPSRQHESVKALENLSGILGLWGHEN